MKFTFKSEHEYGTTVEMTFDEEQLDEIEDMFKLFLRGSGFHIQDEEEISATADKTEISGIADEYTYTTLSTAKVWLEADWYTPEELQKIIDFKAVQEELLRESMESLLQEKNNG